MGGMGKTGEARGEGESERGRLRQLCWSGTHDSGCGDVSPSFTVFPATSVARGGGSDSFAVGGGDVSPGNSSAKCERLLNSLIFSNSPLY